MTRRTDDTLRRVAIRWGLLAGLVCLPAMLYGGESRERVLNAEQFALTWKTDRPAAVETDRKGKGVDAYVASLASVQAAKAAKRPALLLFRCDKQGGPFSDSTTRQTRASRYFELWAFDNKMNAGDYSNHLAARFFDLVKIDVTEVSKEKNEFFCNEACPVIVLTHPDGTVAEVMDGGHTKASRHAKKLFKEMMDVVEKAGNREAGRVIPKLAKVLKERIDVGNKAQQLEHDLELASKNLDEYRRGLRGKQTRSREKGFEKQVEDVKETLEKTRKTYQELVEEELAYWNRAHIP